MRPGRRILGLSGALWAGLTVVQAIVMAMAVPRLHLHPARGAFPLVLVSVVVYLLILWMVYARIRGDAAAYRRAFWWGVVCILASLSWLALALREIFAETKSMFLGLAAIAGVFCWPPLFLMGVVLLAARATKPAARS